WAAVLADDCAAGASACFGVSASLGGAEAGGAAAAGAGGGIAAGPANLSATTLGTGAFLLRTFVSPDATGLAGAASFRAGRLSATVVFFVASWISPGFQFTSVTVSTAAASA